MLLIPTASTENRKPSQRSACKMSDFFFTVSLFFPAAIEITKMLDTLPVASPSGSTLGFAQESSLGVLRALQILTTLSVFPVACALQSYLCQPLPHVSVWSLWECCSESEQCSLWLFPCSVVFLCSVCMFVHQ